MSADDAYAELAEANWTRMRKALDRAATEYRRTADELEAIGFDDPKGNRRTPEAIISQAALTVNAGPGQLMIHQLAIWAETINEIERRPLSSRPFRVLCGYQIEDPHRRCVLDAGHDLPFDDGLVHVDQAGVTFA